MDQPLTLLYLAHLNWDHVWQRPQQLMTRFATRCRVIYCDPAEITRDAAAVHLAERPGADGICVVRPIFPDSILDSPGHSFRELWVQLLPRLLTMAGPNIVLWVSSPRSDYLVAAARPHVRLAVYDCMDDLASFRDGGAELRQREAHLLDLVDLLFTGGHAMYEARKDRHAHAHCFPSGVDAAHYRQVEAPAFPFPAPVAWVPQPRLGYIGVLDERIDWPLIAAIAHERPGWHWVLVGPTAKVHPRELPGGPNIHYVGQRPYAELPAYLRSFDIATMPFALNEATRSISPTKTLEYLAGGMSIMSSSVPDVVAGYRGIVEIADGAAAWLRAIEDMLGESPAQKQLRRDLARPLLAQASWDNIAARMWHLMQAHLRGANR